MPTQLARNISRGRTPAALAIVTVSVALLAGCGQQSPIDEERSAELIQPVARLELKVSKVTPGKRTGEQIHTAICAGCHDSGALAAPKTGNASEWAPRLSLGFDALTASVINGKGAMPPRGGGADLTDTEVKRAVAHLANLAGASFTEPPVEE